MDDRTRDDAGRDGDGPGLPPPAFASDRGGSGKAEEVAVREEGGGQVPEEAFIDPDEPIVQSGTRIADDAFFDPDDPIVRKAPPRKPEDFEEVVGSGQEEEDEEPHEEEEEVVVTGIGNDPHLDDRELAASERHGDPHVANLVEMVGTLADALRDRGEAGLKTTSGMSRFEATLRAYCVGYLAAKREGDDGTA